MTVNKEIHKKMTRYTESIRANANKTEKEQLVSLMEKFNISASEALNAITEELGEHSLRLFEASWELEREANKSHQIGASFVDLDDEDW